MPYLKPCRRCRQRNGCDKKAATLKALRGSLVTAATVKCDRYGSKFQEGQRVVVTISKAQRGYGSISYDEDDESFRLRDAQLVEGPAIFPGTVMRQASLKFMVLLDLNEKNTVVVWVYPDAMTPIDDRWELCKKCDLPVDAEVKNWSCDMCGEESTGVI